MKEISRLRMKFICYNMLIVTAVIGITFCAVAFVMEKRVSAQGRLALAKVVSQEEHPLIFTTRSPAQTPYFSVMVGEDGMVTPWEGGYEAFPGQEFLEEMAFLGMAGEEDMGLLESYHLRYLRVSRPTGYMIAFADTSYEETASCSTEAWPAPVSGSVSWYCPTSFPDGPSSRWKSPYGCRSSLWPTPPMN